MTTNHIIVVGSPEHERNEGLLALQDLKRQRAQKASPAATVE